MNYKIGDTVKVVNAGNNYSLFVRAAKALGADYNPRELKEGRYIYYDGDGGSDHKFKTGSAPSNGQTALVKNIARLSTGSDIYVLIERLSDKQQFVIGPSGLTFHQNTYLENDLFEI